MTKPYRLVVFDWEGTLGDTVGPVLNAISAVARQLHYETFDLERARGVVSLGLGLAIQKLFPDLSLHQQQQFLHTIHQVLATNSLESCLFPGAMDLLESLKQEGVDCAIATNRGAASLQRVLQSLGIKDMFAVTRSAGSMPAKPCPKMLEDIMAVCGVSASETLMVGDSITDIDMAVQIQVDAVGVDFYHQNEPALRAAGAMAVFDEYSQLAAFLRPKQR